MTGRVGGRIGTVSDALRSFFAAERVARRDGFLQSRDPRATLVALLALASAAVVTRSALFLLALAAVTVALAAASEVPMRTLAGRIALVAAPAAFVVSPRLVLAPGDPLVAALGVTDAGAAYVAFFTLRVAVGAALVSLLVLTTPFSDVVAALRRVGVPTALVWVLAVTYRYLFFFFDVLRRMVLARAARTRGGRGVRAGWRDARRLSGTFFLRTLERGERVGRGMRARGGAREPTPHDRTGALTAADIALASAALCCLLAVGVIRWTP